MFMENTILYNDRMEVPEGEILVPIGKAEVKREGKDLSIIAHGRSVIQALKAAQVLEEQHNISVEVVDLRSIRPLDEETILASVRKTHRVLLVEENKPFCGVDAQLSYLIQDKAFDDLDAPIKRVSAIDAPQIYSPPMEKEQLPTPQRILKAALGVLA
jgi:pyruvate dehydrogenase E1 component beta subunit